MLGGILPLGSDFKFLLSRRIKYQFRTDKSSRLVTSHCMTSIYVNPCGEKGNKYFIISNVYWEWINVSHINPQLQL